VSDNSVDAEYVNGSGNRTVVNNVTKTVKSGISFGSCLAMVISYVHWHSVFRAIVHGLLSRGYVIYHVIRY